MNISLFAILILTVIGLAYALGKLLRDRQQSQSSPEARLEPPGDDKETQAVVRWLLSQAFEQTGVAVAGDKIAYRRIVEAAHQALVALQTQTAVTIYLPHLTADATGPKHFEARLTRALLQELIKY